MRNDYSVKIVGTKLRKLVQVLDSNTVPINPPIPLGGLFVIDIDMLSNDQREKLINFMAREYSLPVNEVERLLPERSLTIPAEECIMGYVTQHQIDLLREAFKQNATEAYNGIIERNVVTETFWLSIMIVTFMLGDEWRSRNITANLFTDDKRMGYLLPRLKTEDEIYEHQFRMLLLADSLFSLQNCKGFNMKIEDLQQVSPTNLDVRLEDIVIELQIASMLVRSGHGVRFRRPSRIERQDFDIEIDFRKSSNIFAEIKCKRDETTVNINNLRRTLYKAEKQLPTTNAGILFVRIPTNWIKYKNLAPDVDKVLRNFFNKISHVNAVVFVWEEWISLKNNLKASTLKYRLNPNPLPKYPLDKLNELLSARQLPSETKGALMELSFGEFSDELE